jgi:hypothetical protein
MTKAHPGRVFITMALGCAIGCAMGSRAQARDAFWQGQRGPVWEHGFDPSRGLSNWYSKATGGDPLEPPNGNAIFTRGAKEFEVLISGPFRRIATMAIQQAAPRYSFIIMPDVWLIVYGNGLVNASLRAVNILVREGGVLAFEGGARLVGNQRVANIEVERDATIKFRNTAHGGNAAVNINKGELDFSGLADAGDMTITNAGTFAYPGLVYFYGRSTAGGAKIVNRQYGSVTFFTNGPRGDGRVTAGDITNSSELVLGELAKQLTVQQNFAQTASGTLIISHLSDHRINTILVRGSARVGGTLRVYSAADSPPPPGSYRVLRAQGGLTGRFTLIADHGNTRLHYTSTDVILVIDPP